MQTQWQSFLIEQGGQLDSQDQVVFGDSRQVIAELAKQPALSCTDHLGVLHVGGDDATQFLQAQLSNDIQQLGENQVQLSAYCNPKGRMLAQFLVVPHRDGYLLLLSRDLLDKTLARLKMFVLRSAVELHDVTEQYAGFGVIGDSVASLTPEGWTLPEAPYSLSRIDEGLIIRLPGPFVRYLVLQTLDAGKASWQHLTQSCQVAGSAAWLWCDIQAGLPAIVAATAEEFVPQMTNLELIGGVSFKKGCYPGQEIVARMHYLGKPKRRMFRLHTASNDVPAPGTDLFSGASDGQSAGKVVLAQPGPTQGTDILAVVQLSHINQSDLHLTSPDGPSLRLETLPYALEPAEQSG